MSNEFIEYAGLGYDLYSKEFAERIQAILDESPFDLVFVRHVDGYGDDNPGQYSVQERGKNFFESEHSMEVIYDNYCQVEVTDPAWRSVVEQILFVMDTEVFDD